MVVARRATKRRYGRDRFGSALNDRTMIQQTRATCRGPASMEKAIAIQAKHFAPDHPTCGISYTNLATICYYEGDLDAACANLKNGLTIF